MNKHLFILALGISMATIANAGPEDTPDHIFDATVLLDLDLGELQAAQVCPLCDEITGDEHSTAQDIGSTVDESFSAEDIDTSGAPQ